MNKRLSMLEKLTESGSADSFAWYALAMEYKKEGRAAQALQTFQTLRKKDSRYLPMYLMAGQLLIEANRDAEAREWLEQGAELARATGDRKTLSELEDALHNIA
jgi:predicted Zn-dependent protease